jgi:hypothetical protein
VTDPVDRPAGRTADIRLVGLPVSLHLQAAEHIDGLVREFRWLAAGPSDTPVRILELGAKLRRRSSAVMDPLTAIINDRHRAGEDAVDLSFPVPVEAAEVCANVMRLLDEADAHCVAGGLLTLATPEPAVAYRRWFLGEFIRQIEGQPATPWPASPQAAALASVES